MANMTKTRTHTGRHGSRTGPGRTDAGNGGNKTAVVKKSAALLIAIAVAAVIFPSIVCADTDGSELRIADQPDRLILQLGPEWAGVEFELKTDAGVFPVPVTVDGTGILKMDLGGSRTYTLSCVLSSVAVPGPEQTAQTPTPPGTGEPESGETGSGIPAGHLVLFLGGLAAGVGGLAAMHFFKRRREAYDCDEDEDDYDGENS
jgi:hypothetical protein